MLGRQAVVKYKYIYCDPLKPGAGAISIGSVTCYRGRWSVYRGRLKTVSLNGHQEVSLVLQLTAQGAGVAAAGQVGPKAAAMCRARLLGW